MPMNKPSNGLTNGITAGVNVTGYHLYKQFQGTGTTVTSPTLTNQHGGTGTGGVPNSYSSHAIYNMQKRDEDDDPNYSNLSTVFTISGAGNANITSNLNSPVSENISTSTSSGGSKSSQQSKSHKSKSSNNSKSSHSGPMAPPSLKSPITNNGKWA